MTGDAASDWFTRFKPRGVSALESVEFCLQQIESDTKKRLGDEVVEGCTLEEIREALFSARKEMEG